MWHTGKYSYQLDSKNRMRLPASTREDYGEEFYVSADIRGSLLVRHKDDMGVLCDKLATASMADWESTDAIMWFHERSFCVKQDEQGRFVLPQVLKDYAKIDKNVYIIGMPRGWSIWSEEAYENRNNPCEEHKVFEEIATKLRPYGV